MRFTPAEARQWLQSLLFFVRLIGNRFVSHQGLLNAAALTYTTLFAVVPLMTVTYAMLAAIPSFQAAGSELESLLFEHFVPATGESLRGYLSAFAGQARSLTGVGILVLIVTAILMLRAVENAFNRIWPDARPRRGVASFLLYWAVLSLGPLLLGLGFALSSYLASLPLLSDATEALGGRQRLLALVPFLSSAAAFTLIYAAVPNCRVPVRHALAGGVLVALLFEAAKRGFAFYVTRFPSYELIYGAFAAVPLFLLWIYLSWVIVLLGAELVANLGQWRQLRRPRADHPLARVLCLLEPLRAAQQEGRALGFEHLRRALPGVAGDECRVLLAELQKARVVLRTDQGDYALARDCEGLTLAELTARLPWKLNGPVGVDRPWGTELDRRLQALAGAERALLDIPLSQLFRYRQGETENS